MLYLCLELAGEEVLIAGEVRWKHVPCQRACFHCTLVVILLTRRTSRGFFTIVSA